MTETGRYENATKVFRAALRLLELEESDYEAKVERLRAELQKGFDDYEAGRTIELNNWDDIKAHGESIRQWDRQQLKDRDNDWSNSTD